MGRQFDRFYHLHKSMHLIQVYVTQVRPNQDISWLKDKHSTALEIQGPVHIPFHEWS